MKSFKPYCIHKASQEAFPQVEDSEIHIMCVFLVATPPPPQVLCSIHIYLCPVPVPVSVPVPIFYLPAALTGSSSAEQLTTHPVVGSLTPAFILDFTFSANSLLWDRRKVKHSLV